jgi:hypothetical protein
MCRIASLLLQRLKGSMSGDACDFNNIETRAVIKFPPSARQGAEGHMITTGCIECRLEIHVFPTVKCTKIHVQVGDFIRISCVTVNLYTLSYYRIIIYFSTM